jgi:hypothetical protein
MDKPMTALKRDNDFFPFCCFRSQNLGLSEKNINHPGSVLLCPLWMIIWTKERTEKIWEENKSSGHCLGFQIRVLPSSLWYCGMNFNYRGKNAVRDPSKFGGYRNTNHLLLPVWNSKKPAYRKCSHHHGVCVGGEVEGRRVLQEHS